MLVNTCRDRSFDLDELEDVDVQDEDVEVELLELGTEVTGVTVSQNPVLNLQEASGATISRKRSMQRTSSEKEDISAKAKRSRYSQGSSTHVNVSPHRRVKEFPDEMLDVSAGKLFCDACHTVLGLKKSIISDHLSSERHKEGKERRKQQELRQQRIMQSWGHYQQRHSGNLAGTGLTGTVPPDQALRRIQTATAMLKAGIPLAKVDYLRPLLEENSVRLTYSSHLASYIPFILDNEKTTLRAELEKRPHISVIFDGSTYQGEMLVVLVRFVTMDFQICQRLVRVRILSKSLNSQQLAREIINALSTELQYPSDRVIAVIRDGASVNEAAFKILKDVMYPNVTNIICIAHSLDNIGKHFETDLLDSFLQSWVSLFSHSPASRVAWKNETGQSIKSYSCTRWWSWWEVLYQLHNLFEHVTPFLIALESCPNISRRLREILEDPEQLKQLRLQLAITVDMGKPLVQKTYHLEGDGELVVEAYTHLQEVCEAAALEYYPRTLAVATELAEGDAAAIQAMMTEAKACVAPAVRYFRTKFNRQETPMYEVVRLFKAVRIVCPSQARQLRLTANDVTALRILPALDDDGTITQLIEELPAYVVAAADAVIDADSSRLDWWRNQTRLPGWSRVARIVYALLPSSAPAERVFSLLEAAVNKRQASLLGDHLEASLMLQYNRGRLALE